MEALQARMIDSLKENKSKVANLEKMLSEKDMTVTTLSTVKEDLQFSVLEHQKKLNDITEEKQRALLEIETLKVAHQRETQTFNMQISNLQVRGISQIEDNMYGLVTLYIAWDCQVSAHP